jgi:NitT/TauT family transport system permease protein
MGRIKEMLPSLALICGLIAAWWGVVSATHSVIFPTPWAVVTGTAELLKDGTLWRHISASLLRVAAGFGLAVCVAVPLGL